MTQMQVSITDRPDAAAALERLRAVLGGVSPRIIACSGGIDSLVLSVVAHRQFPDATVIAHTVTPAVPSDGTTRVRGYADTEGWDLRVVESGEFGDEAYLANPVDRCFHCKSNLYRAIEAIDVHSVDGALPVVFSGANLDDLGEYRPGLAAAAQHSVRHPYVEAEISKSELRAIARSLGLVDADLPASPCLASRLYTGTRVTPERLRAVEVGEAHLRSCTGIDVVRCRVAESTVLVEVATADLERVDGQMLDEVLQLMIGVEPSLTRVELDARGYEPGRSFVGERGASVAGR
jgi:uncharacterized protein